MTGIKSKLFDIDLSNKSLLYKVNVSRACFISLLLQKCIFVFKVILVINVLLCSLIDLKIYR